jgi:peptidoglycan/xylan/chitin deacetylase (PgdA/CDA1 family)
MDWLVQHGYRSISFRELIECSSRGVAPVGKPVILSFDDGWTSQCACAPDAATFTTQPRFVRAPSPTERAG